jgi:hypothetical protein
VQQLVTMTTTTRTTTKSEAWPKKIRLGRITVSVYRRITPSGNLGYQVANYASGKRRLDSYPTEVKAVEAANRLARQLSERQVVAASLTNAEAADYAAAVQSLKPHDVALPAAAAVLAECLQTVKDLPTPPGTRPLSASLSPKSWPNFSQSKKLAGCLPGI